jgi:hypothetical protein
MYKDKEAVGYFVAKTLTYNGNAIAMQLSSWWNKTKIKLTSLLKSKIDKSYHKLNTVRCGDFGNFFAHIYKTLVYLFNYVIVLKYFKMIL